MTKYFTLLLLAITVSAATFKVTIPSFEMEVTTTDSTTPPLVVVAPVSSSSSSSSSATSSSSSSSSSVASSSSSSSSIIAGLKYVSKGEVFADRIEAKSSGCMDLVAPSGPFKTTFYSIEKITTTVGSYAAAKPGDYEDALVPTTQLCQKPVWVDVTINKDAAVGAYSFSIANKSYQIKIINFTMPDKPTLPLYIELQSNSVRQAHGLADNVSFQGPITKKYIDLYRAHRIEPIKQNITLYPATDLNQWSAYTGSPKQLMLDGAIAPPCLFGPALSIAPTVAQLQDWEAKIKSGELPLGTWAYAWDEGEYDATATAAALARVKLIKQYAPSLKVMITRQEDIAFNPFVDFYIPVLDWFKQPDKVQTYTKTYGLYTSCMANGTCNNASTPGTPSGTPMMVLDSPNVNQRAFLWVVQKLKGTSSLYFNGTQRVGSAWTDQRNEGGNGDGTLVYPGVKGQRGLVDDTALPSIRMKMLRQASFDLEYVYEAEKRGIAFSSPVTNAFIWSKSMEDYENAKNSIAAKF